MTLTYHPLANIFPLMQGVEFEAFCEDIRRNGQIDPIVVKDGQIIDGRNRHRACVKLGIIPFTEECQVKGSLIESVLSRNVRRRHLNDTQKACAAAMFSKQFEIEAAARMKRGVKVRGGAKGKSTDMTGELFGVSGRYVQVAKMVALCDSKIFDQCLNGKESLSRAKAIIDRARKLSRIRQDFLDGKRPPEPPPRGTKLYLRDYEMECLARDRLHDPRSVAGKTLFIPDVPFTVIVDHLRKHFTVKED